MKKLYTMIALVLFAGITYAAGTYINGYSAGNVSDEVMSQTLNMRPYQVDEASATITYMRYQSGTGSVLLIRYSVSGTVTTCEKAFATWTNRVTATYSAVND